MRKSKGQVALALNIVLTIFVVGSLGMVSYEMSRILLAREQLKNSLELASLAGGVSMASTSLTGTAAQAQAQTVAMNILQMNSVLGQSLNGQVTLGSSSTSLNPTPGKTQVYFEFVDPVTKQVAQAGQQANVLRVYGAYAYPLFSGGFGAIGVSTYTFTAQAMAGMPALDLVIVDNTSGSMDDQTPITVVRRQWDQTTNNTIIYTKPGAGPGPSNEGTISTVFCPMLNGSNLNGLPPQNLDVAGDPRTSKCPKEFSEVGVLGTTLPLRGITNNSPPGDAPPSTPPAGGVGVAGMTVGPGYGGFPGPNGLGDVASNDRPRVSPDWWWPALRRASKTVSQTVSDTIASPAYAHYTNSGNIVYDANGLYGSDPSLFTDVVVNLDGNVHFNGYTDPNFPSYKFPKLDYVVEAARGNMENGNVAPDAWISVNLENRAQTGYQQAYTNIAYKRLQPKAMLENCIIGFMNKVAQTSDCHFAFVAFNDRAGTNPSDTMTAPLVSWAFPVAGNVTYAIPHIPFMLMAPPGNSLQMVSTVLTPPTTIAAQPPVLMVPNGGCNLADGLTQAYNELTSAQARPGAMKAIVVITDKVPDRDLAGNAYADPTTNAGALADAMTVAGQCNTQGIPIFMVTIDQQNGAMTPYLQTQYSDSDPSGVVAKAGHGGALYILPWVDPVTTGNSLTSTFNNVVRQLTALVQG